MPFIYDKDDERFGVKARRDSPRGITSPAGPAEAASIRDSMGQLTPFGAPQVGLPPESVARSPKPGPRLPADALDDPAAMAPGMNAGHQLQDGLKYGSSDSTTFFYELDSIAASLGDGNAPAQTGDSADLQLTKSPGKKANPPALTPTSTNGIAMPVTHATDNSKSTTELGQIGKRKEAYRHGLFHFKPYVAVTVTSREVTYREANMPGFCGCNKKGRYMEKVTGWFGIQNATLYIAKDYKPGSDEYNATLTHEKEHASDVAAVAKAHAAALPGHVNNPMSFLHIHSNPSPLASHKSKAAFEAAQKKSLQGLVVKPYSSALKAKMLERDNKCEYGRVLSKGKKFKHGDHEKGKKLLKKHNCPSE